MTDLRKAAEMAWNYFRNADDITVEGKQVMEALRQALAQPEQKIMDCVYPKCETAGGCNGPCSMSFSTAPPKREWVGLTDVDKVNLCGMIFGGRFLECIDAVEAKLKEKNGG